MDEDLKPGNTGDPHPTAPLRDRWAHHPAAAPMALLRAGACREYPLSRRRAGYRDPSERRPVDGSGSGAGAGAGARRDELSVTRSPGPSRASVPAQLLDMLAVQAACEHAPAVLPRQPAQRDALARVGALLLTSPASVRSLSRSGRSRSATADHVRPNAPSTACQCTITRRNCEALRLRSTSGCRWL